MFLIDIPTPEFHYQELLIVVQSRIYRWLNEHQYYINVSSNVFSLA